jgi:hypothetical protein
VTIIFAFVSVQVVLLKSHDSSEVDGHVNSSFLSVGSEATQ